MTQEAENSWRLAKSAFNSCRSKINDQKMFLNILKKFKTTSMEDHLSLRKDGRGLMEDLWEVHYSRAQNNYENFVEVEDDLPGRLPK